MIISFHILLKLWILSESQIVLSFRILVLSEMIYQSSSSRELCYPVNFINDWLW